MRAINLIPQEERRGAGGAGGRSAGGAYVLVGALVMLVVMAAAYALTSKSVTDRRSELATVKHDTQVAEQRAASLQSYTAFREMRRQRVATVRSIARSRFDWAHALREIARTLPPDATIATLRGTVTSSVSMDGDVGALSLRASMPSNPAIELVGCAPNQDRVAHLLVNLRRIDGVRRVTLQQAGRLTTPSATVAVDKHTVKDCSDPFEAIVFYDPVATVAPPAAAAPASPTTSAASTTTTPSTPGATR